MGAEASREQAVAVSVVDDVVLREPRHDEAAGHELGPGVDVPLRVAHDGGAARGARGGVDPDDARHGYGEHAVGVVVPEVLLRREGEPPQVVERPDVVGPDAGVVEGPFVKPHGVVDALDHLLEPLDLQRLQRLARQSLEFFVVDHNPLLPPRVDVGNGKTGRTIAEIPALSQRIYSPLLSGMQMLPSR